MKRKNQRGFALLLELILAMAVTGVMLTSATVAVVANIRTRNATTAKTRLRQVAGANNALAICAATSGCVPSHALQAMIPAAGTITTEGHVYVYVIVDGMGDWTYSATPLQSGFTGNESLFISNAGTMRCAFGGMNATASSPVCQ